jgi:hypothetical protein
MSASVFDLATVCLEIALRKPLVWLLVMLGTIFLTLLVSVAAFEVLLPIIGLFWLQPSNARHELLFVAFRRGHGMHIYVTPLVARLYNSSVLLGLILVALFILAGLILKLMSAINERRNRYRSDWMQK